MNDAAAGVLTIGSMLGALALIHRPLGTYLANIADSPRDLVVERAIYRIVGVNPRGQQTWKVYAAAVLGFGFVSIVALTALLMLQGVLTPGPHGNIPFAGALNTAVSFVTNTNWQWYSGEVTMNNLTQMLGLAVQNFTSAATGIAVAFALIRGFARHRGGELGNFWVDLTRITVRLLVPIAFVAALILVSRGAVESLWHTTTVATPYGGEQIITGGPAAGQEAIKQLGTNGGGFFNANSGHPFENPTALTNWIHIFLLLLIPTALPRAAGVMLGREWSIGAEGPAAMRRGLRQGYAIVAAMGVLFIASLTLSVLSETSGRGAAPAAAGAALEGKEVAFGTWNTALFATATTSTSTGAVNGTHDSMTAGGGGAALFNMLLGEISPGGVGSGLYGMLIIAIIAVFLAGLMVGRTPEFLGKKLGRAEITLAATATLVSPALVLLGTALAIGLEQGRGQTANPGAHGLSEILYAFASASNNNGSAFAGLGVNTNFYNFTLALAMLLGRFLPILLVLALAGTLVKQTRVPVTRGTLPTHTPLFVGLTVGTALLVTGLTFVPALALGPISEVLL